MVKVCKKCEGQIEDALAAAFCHTLERGDLMSHPSTMFKDPIFDATSLDQWDRTEASKDSESPPNVDFGSSRKELFPEHDKIHSIMVSGGFLDSPQTSAPAQTRRPDEKVTGTGRAEKVSASQDHGRIRIPRAKKEAERAIPTQEEIQLPKFFPEAAPRNSDLSEGDRAATKSHLASEKYEEVSRYLSKQPPKKVQLVREGPIWIVRWNWRIHLRPRTIEAELVCILLCIAPRTLHRNNLLRRLKKATIIGGRAC